MTHLDVSPVFGWTDLSRKLAHFMRIFRKMGNTSRKRRCRASRASTSALGCIRASPGVVPAKSDAADLISVQRRLRSRAGRS